MKVAIFGSCVSRDTCEFMPKTEVVAYIARQSVTSLVSPHGAENVDLSELRSAFQRRMVTGDLAGNGLKRIVENAKVLDLILIDLIDERRGYWSFSDGTSMTNSLEVANSGAAREARRAGARLIEFGTDEHYENWRSGFESLTDGLKAAELWDRTILLDIEWAAALEGAQHPNYDHVEKLGRRLRQLQRGANEASRSLSRGQGLNDAWKIFRNVRQTEAEQYADRASHANTKYGRYRAMARSLTATAVVRSSNEVRIGRDHKWGPQPFHYRESDYRSIVESISKARSAT